MTKSSSLPTVDSLAVEFNTLGDAGTTAISNVTNVNTSSGSTNDNFFSYDTTTDQLYINDTSGATSGQILISGGAPQWMTSAGSYDLNVNFGPYQIKGLEGGDISVTITLDGTETEFIVAKDKVVKFLTKIAYAVIEGA